LLREDESSVCEDVELRALPGLRRGIDPLRAKLGRDTRGPLVVAASDGAIADLDGHPAKTTPSLESPDAARRAAADDRGVSLFRSPGSREIKPYSPRPVVGTRLVELAL